MKTFQKSRIHFQAKNLSPLKGDENPKIFLVSTKISQAKNLSPLKGDENSTLTNYKGLRSPLAKNLSPLKGDENRILAPR